jgi:L-ascorbate metabolism protein UlaG (beta-lactamase superfamily)
VIATLALVAALPGCGRAQQPEPITAGSVAAPAGDARVRYLANEGVLLSLPEGAVLIDGLFGDGLPDYPVVEAAARDSLERGLGAFGDIDLVLVTHVHRDHFHARAVERHLIENPRARLVAPRQVADSLRILGSEYARIEARMHPLDAAPGETVAIEVAGIPIRALGIAHPPSRNEPVEHVAYVVGREPTVAHLGDLGLGSAGIETLTAGRGVAVALVPYWILDGEESVARIEEALAPGCVLGFHVARGEEEAARAWLNERAPGARLLSEPSTVSLAECAGSAASTTGPSLVVPRGDSPTLDGAIDDTEWQGAARVELDAGGEARFVHDGARLYVGIRGGGEGWSHVYLAGDDTVRVLHASAALGSVRYGRAADGSWHTADTFVYELRDTSLSAEAEAARQAHLAAHGWVATLSPMGEPGSQEFAIDLARLPPRPRVAVLYASDPGAPSAWPALSDDTRRPELVRGDAPTSLTFDPDTWAALELAE